MAAGKHSAFLFSTSETSIQCFCIALKFTEHASTTHVIPTGNFQIQIANNMLRIYSTIRAVQSVPHRSFSQSIVGHAISEVRRTENLVSWPWRRELDEIAPQDELLVVPFVDG